MRHDVLARVTLLPSTTAVAAVATATTTDCLLCARAAPVAPAAAPAAHQQHLSCHQNTPYLWLENALLPFRVMPRKQ